MHLNLKGYTLDDVIAYMDKNSVHKCWLLTQELTNPHPYASSVEEVFEAYEKYPNRIVPMYAPATNRLDATERFYAWHKKGIRGCGELRLSLNWESAILGQLLSCVNRLGVPIIFHMSEAIAYHESWETEIQNPSTQPFPSGMLNFALLERWLKEYPKIPFIGHGPLFWKGISSGLEVELETDKYPDGPIVDQGITCRLLSQYKNLYADTSGFSGYNALSRDTEFTRDFISKYANKILFGTDNQSLGLKEFLDSLELPVNTYGLIYSENAAELIN
jgi:predicted TIM-barrel fold metal-dependent hydrolase